jgi:hypothetical protein
MVGILAVHSKQILPQDPKLFDQYEIDLSVHKWTYFHKLGRWAGSTKTYLSNDIERTIKMDLLRLEMARKCFLNN